MKIKLANKLFFLFLLVSILPLSFCGWLVFHRTADVIRDLQYEKLNVLAQERAKIIHELFDERMHDLSLISYMPTTLSGLKQFTEVFSGAGSDSSEYRALEKKYDPYLYKSLKDLSLHNLYLISATGDIVYSTVKESDWGSNLLSGPYKESELAHAFRVAKGENLGKKYHSGFYEPSDRQALFSAVSIMENGEVAGVLAFQMTTVVIDELAQDYSGLGASGETVFGRMQGEDIVMVAPTRHDPDAAHQRVVVMGSGEAKPLQQACSGINGSGGFKDYRGKPVLAAWRYLPTMEMGMVLKIDKKEAYQPIYSLSARIAVMGVGTVLLVLILSLFISRSISKPVTEVARAASRMSEGDLNARAASTRSQDEVGELCLVFNQLAERLQTAHTESEQRNWLNASASKLATTLQGLKNLPELCEDILSFLADTLDAQVGTIALASADQTSLTRFSGYAFHVNSESEKPFPFGEGLMGQAAKDKTHILADDIPADYIRVTSALGDMTPRSILCFPLIHEKKVEGVVELGFLIPPSPQMMTLLGNTAESIATAIHMAQSREKLKELLEESQAQGEELQAQQEELRTTNEELIEKSQEIKLWKLNSE